MIGQYYKVGDKQFINPWQAMLESAETQNFCEYILPEDAKKSFEGIDPRHLPDNSTLITRKTQYLLDHNNSVTLHYTGGIDSHSILLNGKFDNYYMYIRGATPNSPVDQEFKQGIQYCKDNNIDLELRTITPDDHDVWYDINAAFKYADFYPGWNPCWFDYLEPNVDKDIMHVYGWDKPFLYRTDDAWYWIYVDHQDYLRTVKHSDFYQDHFYPALAVGQVYTMKEHFERHHPEYRGWLIYKDTDQQALTKKLGRSMIEEHYQTLKTSANWKAVGFFNYKHTLSIEEMNELGHRDKLDAMVKNHQYLIDTLKDGPACIESQEVNLPVLGKINTVKRVQRIGGIWKMHPDGLELMPHTDVSLL